MSSKNYVTENTFEKHMRAIAKSLETHEKVLEGILGELRSLREDNKYIKDTLNGFVSDVSRNDRKINNLTVRVEKLEVE